MLYFQISDKYNIKYHLYFNRKSVMNSPLKHGYKLKGIHFLK
jgi:hypothetical protein